MEQNKEALETLSGALAIANAKVRQLEEANAQLRADYYKLLELVESQARTIRGLATGRTETGSVFLQPNPATTRKPNRRAAIFSLNG